LKLKIFTLRFSDTANGFDDKPIQEFTADKEVIEYTEHFFIHDKTPYLTVLLSYREFARDKRQKPLRRSDPRMELDEREKEAYEALRAWRAAKAKQEGIPPYMIANNKQIAKMVKLKAITKAELAKVSGIGDAKIKQHGEEILRILSDHQKRVSAETLDEEKGPQV
jgi:ATP-dependent DNA helicase RecQ